MTGPPAHSVGGQSSNGLWCLSSSVGVYNAPRRNITHQKAARGGPVVLPPIWATPCFRQVQLHYEDGRFREQIFTSVNTK